MKPINWGLIGGGRGSQIGPAHRLGARLDGLFNFAAAALDHRPDEGRAYGIELGLDASRSYGDWREMLEGERNRSDRVELVTIATPNDTHYEICKAFLEAGFHVLCEKPLTMNVEQAEDLVRVAAASGKICAVNYGYSGYSLVRHMRAMVARGDIGKVRMVFAEFAHGHHANAADADNPRVRWRYDPAKVGVSAQFADCGIHAMHMASFVTNQRVEKLSADCVSLIPSRELEDDAMVNFRMSEGAVGRLWTSSCAIGRQHGLTIQIFGETGGLRWAQEQPNQLYYTPVGGRTQIIERGEGGLSPEADRSSRVTVGHAEGMPLAFGNIYTELAQAIDSTKQGSKPDLGLIPLVEAGADSIKAIAAVAQSGKTMGGWVNL
ncbi:MULTISPECIES: Gfo/Idh/MocA family protein [unclassified Marinobacterium]|uniref:Gfo/Idh/MocA family protein n=1 Tax=unclassified Marinobacterium TaxID=2644139 RepID=UPI0015691922|nr:MULTISPECIES: Gfo/Idh/MocA family oxidoreductase [unclassified Marinobacterium]NRP53290.1 1,5-anhydro-D-fructose reductase [Marinobacterium sp. xm-v-242]NRP78075.1 1,5-anhydro-D-fructose reductase [Marinobacterium sp. xm-m-383]